MEAFDIIGNFCEQQLLGRPEVFNCFSCLFIILIPYWGLKYSTIHNFWIRIILQLVFFDGFTAFLYHWSGFYIFKHFDEIPMVISVWFGILMILSEISKTNTNLKYVPALVNVFFTSILAINTIPTYNFFFAYSYGLACLSLIPLILYYFHIEVPVIGHTDVNRDIIPLNPNTHKNNRFTTYALFFIGVTLSIISAVFWVISEKYCQYIFILGHSVWHLLMPLGMYYIMTSLEFFQQINKYTKNKNKPPSIVYKYRIFPIIT